MRSILLPLCLLVFCAAEARTQPSLPGERSLSVHGVGSIMAVPDQMRLPVQIGVRGETAAAAMKGARFRAEEILAGLRERGIDAKDIQTSRLSVTQIVDYGRQVQPPPVIGYMGVYECTVQFRGRVMERAGEFMDGAAAAGGVTFGPMSFESSRQRELEREALKGAIADARARAAIIAAELGAVLGKVIRVSESSAAPPVVMRAARTALAENAAPVMAGELVCTSSVDVVFELQ